MSLADDGPPVCPECEKVIMPTWAYCASCGARLDGDEPESEPEVELRFDPPLDIDNARHLREAYTKCDSMKAASRLFREPYYTVRDAMIRHGIHEVDSYG